MSFENRIWPIVSNWECQQNYTGQLCISKDPRPVLPRKIIGGNKILMEAYLS